MSTHKLNTNLTFIRFYAGPAVCYTLRLAEDIDWPEYTNEHITKVYIEFEIESNTDLRYMAAWKDTTGNRIKIERGDHEIRTVEIPSEYWSKADAKIALCSANYGQSTQFSSFARNVCMVFETQPNAEASTISSVSVANVGAIQTVALNQSNPELVYHIVSWSYSKNSQTIISGTQTLQSGELIASWSISESDISNLFGSSDTVAYGNVTVETFLLDGTSIGSDTKSGSNVQLILPSSLASPVLTVSSVKGWISNVPQDIQTQYANDYLQSLSTITITPTVTYKYGASGSAQNTVVYTTSEFTEPIQISDSSATIVIGASGTYMIFVTATDTRNYSTTWSVALNVFPCEAPKFTQIDIHRCISAQDSTPNDEGEFVYVAGTVTLDNKASAVEDITVAFSDRQTTYSITEGTSFSAIIDAHLDIEHSCTVTVSVTDDLGQKSRYRAIIASAIYTIYRLAGGRAVSFGKPAELRGVEVAPEWPFYTHGKEIQQLIMDVAHPVGSILEVLNDSINPNEEWPYTLWAKIHDNTISDLTVSMWVRAK